MDHFELIHNEGISLKEVGASERGMCFGSKHVDDTCQLIVPKRFMKHATLSCQINYLRRILLGGSLKSEGHERVLIGPVTPTPNRNECLKRSQRKRIVSVKLNRINDVPIYL
ncbi:hypothetical protein M422DRAFT_30865 [Sphaerobolus stellatus SS14]|uniref:Uncharacterized protein n=1 Tax=Sphaerobolus stellatus (strain SS14) TaxID=990650 RepID=A0A0C9VY45_SPHS4|nr:hypothetical protein M422DRAFT_31641 [Sphaerobolus stellatus SS14]KIJ43376.1 hypothetical protein M422DRAFT_30865 [Sphaerobolus stellatus SS14]